MTSTQKRVIAAVITGSALGLIGGFAVTIINRSFEATLTAVTEETIAGLAQGDA